MTKKKILVISDSLGLPRENPDGMVYYHETWPSLLKHNFEVVHLGIGGATIDMLVSQAGYYRFCNPDIVIVQSGIVDCAPRTMTKKEKEFWLNFPLINKIVYRIVYKYPNFLRKLRTISLTPPKEYKNQLIKLKKIFPKNPVFALSILEAKKGYEQKLPGISKRINDYNLILHDIFGANFINLSELKEGGICSDFHHLNTKGHSYISNQLLEILNNFNV